MYKTAKGTKDLTGEEFYRVKFLIDIAEELFIAYLCFFLLVFVCFCLLFVCELEKYKKKCILRLEIQMWYF